MYPENTCSNRIKRCFCRTYGRGKNYFHKFLWKMPRSAESNGVQFGGLGRLYEFDGAEGET